MKFSVNAFRMSSEERNATMRNEVTQLSPEGDSSVPKGDTEKGSHQKEYGVK